MIFKDTFYFKTNKISFGYLRLISTSNSKRIIWSKNIGQSLLKRHLRTNKSRRWKDFDATTKENVISSSNDALDNVVWRYDVS